MYDSCAEDIQNRKLNPSAFIFKHHSNDDLECNIPTEIASTEKIGRYRHQY